MSILLTILDSFFKPSKASVKLQGGALPHHDRSVGQGPPYLLLKKQIVQAALLVRLTGEFAGHVTHSHIDIASTRGADCPAGILVEGETAVELIDH